MYSAAIIAYTLVLVGQVFGAPRDSKSTLPRASNLVIRKAEDIPLEWNSDGFTARLFNRSLVQEGTVPDTGTSPNPLAKRRILIQCIRGTPPLNGDCIRLQKKIYERGGTVHVPPNYCHEEEYGNCRAFYCVLPCAPGHDLNANQFVSYIDQVRTECVYHSHQPGIITDGIDDHGTGGTFQAGIEYTNDELPPYSKC